MGLYQARKEMGSCAEVDRGQTHFVDWKPHMHRLEPTDEIELASNGSSGGAAKEAGSQLDVAVGMHDGNADQSSMAEKDPEYKFSEEVTNVALSLNREEATRFGAHLSRMEVGCVQAIAEGIDVADIYSPPRIAKMAQRMGLKAGWSHNM